MANTAGKGKVRIHKDFGSYLHTFLLYFVRIIIIILAVLMVLLIWTDDLYDYTSWDLPLGLQLLGFVGLIFGFILFFFKPKTSGWIIIISSVFFWIVTSIFRGIVWLGSLFLIFPLIGTLILVLEKLNYSTKKALRKR
ncbi:MAG: hypothetical protein N2560_06150 [Ignavibacteria bacterium]|nr:hypothetical protein [Ignavibacteria bacterium]